MPDRHPTHAQVRAVDLLPPLLLVVASVALCLVSALRPVAGDRLAGVFPPWWSDREVFEAASSAGPVVATGGVPFVVAIASTDVAAADRLHRSGAIVVINGARLPSCAVPNSKKVSTRQ